MPSEVFGLSAVSIYMLVTFEISPYNSNTKYDPPENDGNVIQYLYTVNHRLNSYVSTYT